MTENNKKVFNKDRNILELTVLTLFFSSHGHNNAHFNEKLGRIVKTPDNIVHLFTIRARILCLEGRVWGKHIDSVHGYKYITNVQVQVQVQGFDKCTWVLPK